jgi:hypothetical protein
VRRDDALILADRAAAERLGSEHDPGKGPEKIMLKRQANQTTG